MLDGERQVAPTLDGIRRDHVARYEWAARTLAPGSNVLDVACGVGYGALILAQAGHKVTAIDRDAEAVAYAMEHYAHPSITYRCMDVSNIAGYVSNAFDAAVCFEAIEHLQDPLPMLRNLREACPLLLASVPNETFFPYQNYRFHFRHYTSHEFDALLRQAGFAVTEALGQRDAESSVGPHMGRTLVVRAARAAKADLRIVEQKDPIQMAAAPTHVVILGLGPSLETYVDLVKRLGSRHAFADEVWGINAVAGVIQCDRVWHMDDLRIQEARAAAAPDSNIAHMVKWLRTHPGPVYTSRTYPEYPGLVAFPLEAVINSCGIAYFNSTAAYAVAYAVHIGVKQISLFGFDFTYSSSHKAERGRGCVEFHLGIAKARGIQIGFPESTSLMDACAPVEERMYGYDTVDLDMQGGGDEPVRITMTPRDTIATAAEIEQRYDHSRSTVPAHLQKQG